ncbi:MAG: prolipoprotein diacylglyceryl transferase [Nanoarchaeota archaeon]
MFTHMIDPVFMRIGPLAIRYYSLAYILGAVAAYVFIRILIQKKHITFLNKEQLESLILTLMVGLIIGGRFGYFLFYNPGLLFDNPLQVLTIWQGGMSFHGGLLGALLGGIYFARKHKIAFYDLADLLVVPVSFGLFLGRIANFINGEVVGIPWQGPFCIDYSQNPHIANPVDLCRHPSQLYEAAKNLLLALVTGYTLWKRFNDKIPKGFTFWTFAMGYGLLRFTVNFWRDDPALLPWFGISTGQVLSLTMGVIGIGMLTYLWVHDRKKI